MSNVGIFIFTRDLRLEDNTGLIKALKECDKVIPIFIFTPDQVTNNSYKSDNCVQFMIECLEELDSSLKKRKSKLFYFYGDIDSVLEKIIKSEKNITGVYINEDYTPFAKKREKLIEKICKNHEILFNLTEDHMLTGKDKVKKGDGGYYLKFTPYYNAAKKIKIESPQKNSYTNYISGSHKIPSTYTKSIHDFYEEENENIFVRGGRKNAITILKKIKKFSEYNKDREIPSLEGTTHLSAYIKFNVVSIREVYKVFKYKLAPSNKLLTQLYWRDFYMQISAHNEIFKTPMKKGYNINWENNAGWIKKWKEGITGIPIVDAGMRQMNTTGWMHNRVRMIVSNFLIKVLKCDWIIGEKYFAQNLVDYDPHSNNGGWQWSASVGADSQPYFRVFNPWRQAENYDSECVYIKKWIPELKDVPNKDILKWNESYKLYKKVSYPKPMIEDIQEEFKKTLKLYSHRK
jgi:deoxyribodipyrimidine photo-lyase